MKIAEASFSGRKDLVDGVRTQLGGGATWADRNDYTSYDGMMRALHSAGPHKKELARIVGKFLGDDDLNVRTGAAEVASQVAKIMGADYLAKLAIENRALLEGVAPVGHELDRPSLWWEVLVGMASSVTKADEQAIQLFRTNVTGECGAYLLGALARTDADWLVDHATTVVDPMWLLAILRNLSDRDQRERVVRSIPWTREVATEVLGKTWPSLPFDQEEIDSLRKLIDDAAG